MAHGSSRLGLLVLAVGCAATAAGALMSMILLGESTPGPCRREPGSALTQAVAPRSAVDHGSARPGQQHCLREVDPDALPRHLVHVAAVQARATQVGAGQLRLAQAGV